ncbi:MAG: DUF1512 domain-containing protein [Candidatus Aenigmarchaeota archaeon]|nr:DUF1512 domain-containing protein [Candidatus Aenigmarchaeota archaeon]MBU5688813.1 DUF1512 domain-containing protein [Candidatus Aenigmarchaeota archaeon]
MVNILNYLTGQSDGGVIGQIISIIIFILFISLYSKIMVQQTMLKLEQSAAELDRMALKAENEVLKKLKDVDKKKRKSIKRFLEFYAIPPVSLDPYGIVKKYDHILTLEKERFNYFAAQIAPEASEEERANIVMGLSGAIELNMIRKIVRHYVELIKKTKSINLAFIIQMQLPFIERIAKSLLKGTEALANGWPIGDGVGPYVAAKIIGNEKAQEIDEETVVARKKYKDKELIIIKAKGPGGRTGNPGKALEKIAQKEKIAKIITVDAAAKLEGERTGEVAEGIGVAMGGIGVERYEIEEVAVKNKIPLDSIIIKMGQEEAIMPMPKAVLDAVDEAIELVYESVDRTKGKGKVVIIGVGNTCGIGNNSKNLENSDELIKKNAKKLEEEEKAKKKKFRIPLFE